MKFNEKPYQLDSIPTLSSDPFKMFENLDNNIIGSIENIEDREYFTSDMGFEDQARVKTRDMWRNNWGGKNFFREHNRLMRDDEVDAALVDYFKLNPNVPLDYVGIQEDLRKERDLFYTGDYENLTTTEFIKGTGGAFLKWAENLTTELGSLGVDFFGNSTAARMKQTGTLLPPLPMGMGSMSMYGVVPKAQRLSEAEKIKRQTAILSSKMNELIDFLPDSLKDDLEELRIKAGDDEANWFVSSLAATAANSPNLAAGIIGQFFPGGQLLAMGGMYAQEQQSSLDSFEKLFDIPSVLPENADAILVEKYNRAVMYSRAYGLMSAGIEYIQTGGFLKLAGIKKGARPKTLPELLK